mmetsp:Transcript_46689/g.109864  ORF Transcript_46689/g.109864 Transcript_46689/m.109864 type:complete len:277 (-) Transcript_46689:2144-2974(-)
MVELVHELDPMKPESVEERRQRLHAHEHTEREAGPGGDGDEEHEGAGALEANLHHCLLPEHLGELRVGEGEGPETEVGGGVGDAPEHVLDGVDHLVHHLLPEVELAMATVATAAAAASAVVVVVVQLVVLHGLVARLEDVGLREQQHRHRRERDQDQEDLQATLARDHLVLDRDGADLHEHLDQRVEQRGRALLPQRAVRRTHLLALLAGELLENDVAGHEHVALNEELVVVLHDSAARSGSAVAHAPHVLRERRELGSVARDRSAVVPVGWRPTG